MTATASRIGFITNEYRKVVAQSSAPVTHHGGLARESEDPVPTYFDTVTSAQQIANGRQALLSEERRRFRVTVTGLNEVLALTYLGAVPLGVFTDTERGVSRDVIVSDITIDFDKQSATLTVWG
jgi:hypothetical protein